MLTVVKRQPTRDELNAWLATVSGFISGAMAVDDKPVTLYDYQREFNECPARFRAVLKARQTGFSFDFAAEALAKAHLKPGHTAVFVSYNLEDAKEKIRYAGMLYDAMPTAWQMKLVTDNKTELEFEDSRGRRSRLISNPCREPRGKGKADVYLDELAFYRNARRIYTAAVPIITRGGGTLTVASTPLGKTGIFYEIVEGEAEKYPHFARFQVPWWHCPDFCTDVGRARRDAEEMSTDERVRRFGTSILQLIRQSMDLESFQQEYECLFIDEATAYIPWDLILAASKDQDELEHYADLEEFLHHQTQGPLWAGFDVGRTRNASELIVVEQVGDRFYQRLMVTLEKERFQVQKDTLIRLLEGRADVRRLCIDATGIGAQLAEEMTERYPSRAEAVTFTNAVKSELASRAKIAFEDRNVWIPAHRDLMQQVHSVKRIVTAAGNVRFDSEHDEKHHADKFWALALALHAAHEGRAAVQDPHALEILRSLKVHG
ncbi:MAG: terminase family protein [Bacillota bacterium]|nr:terminase family protein [Bacillota bacterium]